MKKRERNSMILLVVEAKGGSDFDNCQPKEVQASIQGVKIIVLVEAKGVMRRGTYGLDYFEE